MTDARPALYVLTTEDPLFSDLLIERLVERYPGQIRGVGLTGGLLTRKRLLLSPLIYGFFRYAVLGTKVVWSMFFGGKIGRLCKRHGIQVDHLPSVKDGKLHEILKEREVQLMISINCSRKLHVREFAGPEHGTINLHNSALPEYRGLMPILHAIREGRSENGITIHFINEKLDDGGILAQDFVPIRPGDELLSVWKRCVEHGCEMLPRVIDQVLAGDYELQPNDEGRGSYYSFPSLEQIRAYRRAVRALAKRRE